MPYKTRREINVHSNDDGSHLTLPNGTKQEALQMQSDRAMRRKYEISHLKRPAIGEGNDLQGHASSVQLLLLDGPYTSITSC